MAKFRIAYGVEGTPTVEGGEVLYPIEMAYEEVASYDEAYDKANDANIYEPGVSADVEIYCEEHGWQSAYMPFNAYDDDSAECTICREIRRDAYPNPGEMLPY